MPRSLGTIGRYIGRHHVALLALFFGLAGTSYAASSALLPTNSVRSKQVANGSLQTVDLSKAARKSLRGAPGARGSTGVRGPTGPQGVQGVAGAAGAPGLANVQLIDMHSATDSTSPKFLSPTCPGNQRAISVSGFTATDVTSSGYVALTHNVVTGNNAGWVGGSEIAGGTAGNWTLYATLVCADVR